MWIMNCILLMVGTVAAVMGISFYLRNREAAGKIRLYIFCYGITSAIWCISYGLVGISDDFQVCEVIRKFGVFGYVSFFFTEVLLATEMSGIKRKTSALIRWCMIVICVVDCAFYAKSGVDIFIREENWTTWNSNPEYALNRWIHTGFITTGFLVLLILWIIWNRNSRLKRHRRFLFMALVSNCGMLFFTLPDFVFPIFGLRAVSTSGIGGALCAIVMWYGATQLTSFDIRMGRIKDKIFDFMEAGIIVMDMDRKLSLVNRYAMQYEEQKETGDITLSDFFKLEPDEEEKIYAEAHDGIYAGRFWDKKGAGIFSVRVKAVEDDYGDPFCYMCVFVDVTEEMATANRLEIASQAKTRFLAQMSHEIRTPINAVLGMNEMILRETKEKEILEYAENIDSAGNTLLTLINSILDFSKIEDGKMDIIPVQYDTASFINDLVNSVLQRAEAKELAFRAEVDDSLPAAMVGDDVRLSQVVMNLLTNAVKYTEKGSITLTIRTEECRKDRILLYIAVKDTGIGIREEDVGKLFLSFERLDEIRNHNIEGTGLGISIVKSLLGMMGSSLQVESTYGEGSTFSFVVEQTIADATPIGNYEERVRNSRRGRDEEELISAPGARILVVDDNHMNLKVARNLLRLCKIEPELVTSGETAIEKMRKNTYDVVLLDHMMPGLDGIETLKRLQEEDLIPEGTAVIALTANAVVGSRETYLKAGFRDYISKPIDLGELIRQLRKYLPAKAYEMKRTQEKSGGPDEAEILEFFPEEEPEILEFVPGTEEKTEEKQYDLQKLNEVGLKTETGLRYCAGNREFYFEVLDDFVSTAAERTGLLDGYYEVDNLRQYEVQVHAMKSNLRTIGAGELSDRARILEESAEKGNVEYLNVHHRDFVAEVRELARRISRTKG